MTEKAIILLSGGLDSVCSLAAIKDDYDVEMALTFDYGQKAADKEIKAAKNVCDFYGIQHRIIPLNWLEIITQTSLVSNMDVPLLEETELDDISTTINTMDSVWVPNRNGLFINIAASFADSFKYDVIVFGANKEEGTTFKDNTEDFVEAINLSLENSTGYPVKVLAPLIKYNKNDIVKFALEKDVPLKFIRSCYLDDDRQCGQCESCLRLKRALDANKREDLIKLLF